MRGGRALPASALQTERPAWPDTPRPKIDEEAPTGEQQAFAHQQEALEAPEEGLERPQESPRRARRYGMTGLPTGVRLSSVVLTRLRSDVASRSSTVSSAPGRPTRLTSTALDMFDYAQDRAYRRAISEASGVSNPYEFRDNDDDEQPDEPAMVTDRTPLLAPPTDLAIPTTPFSILPEPRVLYGEADIVDGQLVYRMTQRMQTWLSNICTVEQILSDEEVRTLHQLQTQAYFSTIGARLGQNNTVQGHQGIVDRMDIGDEAAREVSDSDSPSFYGEQPGFQGAPTTAGRAEERGFHQVAPRTAGLVQGNQQGPIEQRIGSTEQRQWSSANIVQRGSFANVQHPSVVNASQPGSSANFGQRSSSSAIGGQRRPRASEYQQIISYLELQQAFGEVEILAQNEASAPAQQAQNQARAQNTTIGGYIGGFDGVDEREIDQEEEKEEKSSLGNQGSRAAANFTALLAIPETVGEEESGPAGQLNNPVVLANRSVRIQLVDEPIDQRAKRSLVSFTPRLRLHFYTVP